MNFDWFGDSEKNFDSRFSSFADQTQPVNFSSTLHNYIYISTVALIFLYKYFTSQNSVLSAVLDLTYPPPCFFKIFYKRFSISTLRFRRVSGSILSEDRRSIIRLFVGVFAYIPKLLAMVKGVSVILIK